MKEYHLNVSELKDKKDILNIGDIVYLSGDVYSARDAAHKRLSCLINNKQELPFNIKDKVIYYAGPTPSPTRAIGSCGPTTSSRMDKFTPLLLKEGLLATIGKGPRSEEVLDEIKEKKSVYFCAIGGAGAIASKHILNSEVVGFEDLGCEAIHKLKFEEFPLIVAFDIKGNDIYKKVEK